MAKKLSPHQREALELLATGNLLIVRVKLESRHYCFIRTVDKVHPFFQVSLLTFHSLVNKAFITAIDRDEEANSDWVITEAGRAALASDQEN